MPGAAEEEVAFARTPAWVEDGVEHFTHFSLNGEQYRLVRREWGRDPGCPPARQREDEHPLS